MEQGLVKTYPGDPVTKKSTFHVDRLIQTPPASLDLPTLKNEQYVTVPSFFMMPLQRGILDMLLIGQTYL